MLKKINVSESAAKLNKPFAMMNVALVGDIVVSVYICQGILHWHRHLDSDELFWVYKGTISLESEWGKVRLRPGELAIVPKGVGHRSGSGLRASVMLLRCGYISERKNGRHRLYAIADEAKLKPVNLQKVVETLISPFQFQTVAQIEDTNVQVAWGEGAWPVEIPAARDRMFFILSGAATVRTPNNMLHLHMGELTVLSKGMVYRLSTTKGTALVRVTV